MSLEDLLRRQLLEKDRENDRVGHACLRKHSAPAAD